jgi:hypothetical protein
MINRNNPEWHPEQPECAVEGLQLKYFMEELKNICEEERISNSLLSKLKGNLRAGKKNRTIYCRKLYRIAQERMKRIAA